MSAHDDYGVSQHERDARAKAEHLKWFASLTPEDRAEASRLGLDEPPDTSRAAGSDVGRRDVRRRDGGREDGDASQDAIDPCASPLDDVDDSLDAIDPCTSPLDEVDDIFFELRKQRLAEGLAGALHSLAAETNPKFRAYLTTAFLVLVGRRTLFPHCNSLAEIASFHGVQPSTLDLYLRLLRRRCGQW